MKTIHVRRLSELMSDGNGPRVIDVRDGDAYAAGHIPGAQHIPVKRIQYSPGFVPDDRDVVVYANSSQDEETASHEAARTLAEEGIEVQVLEGGLAAWIEAGYPVDFD